MNCVCCCLLAPIALVDHYNSHECEPSLKLMWKGYQKLRFAQATPVLGPLLVAPITLATSAIQTTAGLTAAVASLPFTLATSLAEDHLECCNHSSVPETCFQATAVSLYHSAQGGLMMTYTTAHILSLGVLGYQIENYAEKCCYDPL